jgi:hypothetical protein
MRRTRTALLLASSLAGQVSIPATLRYQACDASVCYPPAKAPATWTTTAAAAM